MKQFFEWPTNWLYHLMGLDQAAPPAAKYPPGQVEELMLYLAVLIVDVYLLAWIGLALWRWYYPAAQVRQKWYVALGKGLVLAAVPLCLLEFGLRAYVSTQRMPESMPYLPHPTCLWRFQPNVPTRVFTPIGDMSFVPNSLGLRDNEIPIEKAPDEFRIVVLGDSHTFGQSIDLDKTYSKVLQRLLEAKYPGRKFTVINAGIPGYSILQGYYFYLEVVQRYHPDLVVVAEFNEFQDRAMGDFAESVPRSAFGRWVKSRLWDSTLYMTLRKELMRLRPARVAGAPTDAADSDTPILSVDETTHFIAAFIELFRAQNTKAVFALWRRPEAWSSIYRKLLADVPSDAGIVFVDYHSRLLGSHAQEYWLPNDPSHHPSERGHEMIAEALLQTFESNHLIPSPP